MYLCVARVLPFFGATYYSTEQHATLAYPPPPPLCVSSLASPLKIAVYLLHPLVHRPRLLHGASRGPLHGERAEKCGAGAAGFQVGAPRDRLGDHVARAAPELLPAFRGPADAHAV